MLSYYIIYNIILYIYNYIPTLNGWFHTPHSLFTASLSRAPDPAKGALPQFRDGPLARTSHSAKRSTNSWVP